MSLIKWKNETNFPSLMENFFSTDPFDWSVMNTGRNTIPAVNIRESKDDYHVEVAAPGMKKDDFHIEVENNMLVISSETESKSEEKDEGYTRREYNYQSFRRAFNLPQTAKVDNITAKYDDGVLNITIPKKEEARESAKKEIKIS